MMGNIEFSEEERLLEYWHQVLHKEGILIVSTTFDEGKCTLGGKIVETKGRDIGFQTFIVSKAERFRDLTYQDSSAENIILNKTKPENLENLPDHTEFIAIGDLSKFDIFEVPKAIEGMIGIVDVAKSINAYHDRSHGVYCTLLFPREYLKDLLQQIQAHPTLIRDITKVEIPELDTLDTRQKAERVILTVNAKGPKSLFPTKISRTFDL